MDKMAFSPQKTHREGEPLCLHSWNEELRDSGRIRSPGSCLEVPCRSNAQDQLLSSQELGLESLPPGTALPGLASPERAGNCFIPPQKMSFMEVVGFSWNWAEWAAGWGQRSSQEFLPFPGKSGKQLQLQDGSSAAFPRGHFHAGIKIKSVFHILRP